MTLPWRSAPFLLLTPALLGAQNVPTFHPAAGIIITSSVRLDPGTYRISAPADPNAAVITVRGDNITVDLTGVRLLGADSTADPDAGAGVAIKVDGGHNVRIHHGALRGYKVGILARGTVGLTIDSVDVSYNWKPRLLSLVEHESLADWLSFHHNENDEWLRFGAGMYLAGVRGGRIRGNRGVQGMNGLLLVRSDSLEISENEFSFNSGLGIGLYRSSDNVIVRNRLDYNVRGYSHGFYHRGQDSADLLMFEQSSRNVVAYNSATHGGDGLFLWAGQTTMDSGTGGANDNTFLRNDFSYAPANGMEATFSRNVFAGNLATGNDYGLWGGYSWGSAIAGNCFAGNRVGVAIEHGQDNRILANRFTGDGTAITLWGDSVAPSDWGYPKHRDIASRGYTIVNNIVQGARIGLRSARTSDLKMSGNAFRAVDSALVLRDTAGFEHHEPPILADTATMGCAGPFPQSLHSLEAVLPGVIGQVPVSAAARRDRSAIVVDEWGPYDWKTPKLWPLDSVRSPTLRLRVLGPAGEWRLVDRHGITTVSATRGTVGDTIAVTPQPDSSGDWNVTLAYTGEATTSPRGVVTPAGRAVPFSYEHFEPAQQWSVRIHAWGDSTDPRTRAASFSALLRGPPQISRQERRLDYMWYQPAIAGLSRERWALEATSTVTLPPGTYTLRTISDDGVRVWVDGGLAISDWSPHESAVDNVPIKGGRHALRVQYYQVDGWTELRLDFLRGRVASTGPPGPH